MHARAHIAVLAAAIPALASIAHAAPGDQLLKLRPAAGAAEAAFGGSVALQDGLAVVGSPSADGAAAGSGAVFLFDARTGAEGLQLLPADGASGDLFGCSVAIDGGLIAVGARGDDDLGASAGSVYFFDAATGTQVDKLLAPDGAAGDEFGCAVDLDGGRLVAGARYDDDMGAGSGSAHVFDAATGDHLHKLLAADGVANDTFGGAVAIDAGVVAVGAHAKANGAMFLAGAAYLFDAESGDELHVLRPDDASTNDFFGSAIALDGGTVVVGAWAKSIVFDHSGAAYLFDAATGTQTGSRLVPADSADRDNFGRAVAISGGIVAIAAPGSDENGFESGSGYLYRADDGTELTEFRTSDGVANDRLGSGIAIDRGRILVGCDRDDDDGLNSGSAYVFEAGPDPCPADVTGFDGAVTLADLVAVLATWGTDGPGAAIAAPFDITGFEDLLVVLEAWGPCPSP